MRPFPKYDTTIIYETTILDSSKNGRRSFPLINSFSRRKAVHGSRCFLSSYRERAALARCEWREVASGHISWRRRSAIRVCDVRSRPTSWSGRDGQLARSREFSVGRAVGGRRPRIVCRESWMNETLPTEGTTRRRRTSLYFTRTRRASELPTWVAWFTPWMGVSKGLAVKGIVSEEDGLQATLASIVNASLVFQCPTQDQLLAFRPDHSSCSW